MKFWAMLICLFDRFNDFYNFTKSLDGEMGQNVDLCIALAYVGVVGVTKVLICV